MTKKVDFKVLSEKTCSEPGCSRKIKKNVADRYPDEENLFCYFHYQVNIRKNHKYLKKKGLLNADNVPQ